MTVPNYANLVAEVYARGRHDLVTKEGCGRFTEACATALHQTDPEFGHLRKNPGQNQYRGHAVDAVLYRRLGWAVDIIQSSESAAARPGWSLDEIARYTVADWIQPQSGGAGVVPIPVQPPTVQPPTILPPNVDLGPLTQRLETVERRLGRVEEMTKTLTLLMDKLDYQVRRIEHRVLIAEGSTSRTFGHGHPVRLIVREEGDVEKR